MQVIAYSNRCIVEPARDANDRADRNAQSHDQMLSTTAMCSQVLWSFTGVGATLG